MLTTITNIEVTDVHSGKRTFTAASGWIVSESFANGAPSSPFTVFLEKPTDGEAWNGAHLHQVTSRELGGPLRGVSHLETIPSTPKMIALW